VRAERHIWRKSGPSGIRLMYWQKKQQIDSLKIRGKKMWAIETNRAEKKRRPEKNENT